MARVVALAQRAQGQARREDSEMTLTAHATQIAGGAFLALATSRLFYDVGPGDEPMIAALGAAGAALALLALRPGRKVSSTGRGHRS